MRMLRGISGVNTETLVAFSDQPYFAYAVGSTVVTRSLDRVVARRRFPAAVQKLVLGSCWTAAILEDGRVALWDPKRPQLHNRYLHWQGEPITAAVFRKANSLLAVHKGNELHEWYWPKDPRDAQRHSTHFETRGSCEDAAYLVNSNDGKFFAFAEGFCHQTLTIAGKGKLESFFRQEVIYDIASSPRAQLLAAARQDGCVDILAYQTGAWREVVKLEEPWDTNSLAFTHSGEYLIVAAGDEAEIEDAEFCLVDGEEPEEPRHLSLWHVASSTRLAYLPLDVTIYKVVSLLGDRQLLAALIGGTIAVFDLELNQRQKNTVVVPEATLQ